jgi:hypothetical protein
MGAGPYEMTTEVWRYPDASGWYFVTLPPEVTDEIRTRYGGSHRAFGSLPVSVGLGHSEWSTSVYFDVKAAAYLLPLKADVRRREHVDEGDAVTVRLAIKR